MAARAVRERTDSCMRPGNARDGATFEPMENWREGIGVCLWFLTGCAFAVARRITRSRELSSATRDLLDSARVTIFTANQGFAHGTRRAHQSSNGT